MQDKTKNIITVIGFVFILLSIFFINILTKDEKISVSERRKLAEFPEITAEEVFKRKHIRKIWEICGRPICQKRLI